MVYRLQGARVQLSSIIVMLSRASPQSDAQHDGRAAKEQWLNHVLAS